MLSKIAIYTLCIQLLNACIYIPINSHYHNKGIDLTDTMLELIVEGATSDRSIMTNNNGEHLPSNPITTASPIKDILLNNYNLLIDNTPCFYFAKSIPSESPFCILGRAISVLSPPPDNV